MLFLKSAILAIFYFAPGGFQSTAKGIFISKDLKLGEISRKSTFNFLIFQKNLKIGHRQGR